MMKKLNAGKSSDLKESDNLLKTEEHFVGFDVNDEVSIKFETKRQRVKKNLYEIKGIPMKEDEGSSPIVHNYRVNKKKHPRSSVSSQEANNTKHSQSSNKRIKKDNVHGETIESLESNTPPSLDLTIPTFNLTLTPKCRRSTGRKLNVDISDPIFKLPFEHGWKRELVYRTSGDSSSINRANRNGDVYYYSPINRKLRSLREIQEQLDLSLTEENPLTIESFTFLKQPIGINDRSKELIRDANAKLSKEDSFVGVTVRPKKVKTPVRPFDYELSNNETKKSASKMKIVFKNSKISKPKPKKDKTNSEEPLSSPEYTNEDWQSVQSSVTPKATTLEPDDVKINVAHVKRRLSTSDGEVIMQAPCGIRCPNSDEPATLMCSQCLVYYHPACVNLNASLKIIGYVCINCRSDICQQNKQVELSHTVVGSPEPKQLRVEPIRIRQVHQASDTPNFIIDRTPIIHSEESNYESDHHSEENIIVLNTVTCQGNVIETAMVNGNFHEQYVYEMKQTRGPSLMTCVIQEPKYLDENPEMNGSLKEVPTQIAYMESFNHMVKALRHVFSYLKVQELLSASRVCTAWHIIAMDRLLWQNVRLKNSMVYDWNKFVDTINNQGTVSLDTRRMLMPTKVEEFENVWFRFSMAIKKATKLKTIELYRCPIHVVEDIIYSLPQLSVLNATSLRNPNSPKDSKSPNEFMTLNLGYLGQLTNLTELRLKGPPGIKLSILPSFDKLLNLRTLSLTSIKAFPSDWCSSLESITTGLEVLEIGDCDFLSKDFAKVLQRLNNLTSLRLENCVGRWEHFAQDVFIVIRNLEKLRILELINIDFSNSVEDELEKCSGIKALLIIPTYISQSATTNCHLIDCLKKLSKTLTHLVWGLTYELLRVTDLFLSQYEQNQKSMGYNLELSHTRERANNIPILRVRNPRLRPGEKPVPENEKDKAKSDNVDILSVPALEKLLETMMIGANIKVLKIPFSATTRVYLAEQFNDLLR